MTTKKLTNETFIAKANIIHNNLYNYSQTVYISSKEKVKIICREHGSFEQQPAKHLFGNGCSVCGKEAAALAKSATAKSEFATKSNLIHNNKYSYELVAYKNNYTKVKIMCPIHGEFLQSPTNHLSKRGCSLCANIETGWTRTKFKDKCIKNNNSQGTLYIIGCWSDDKKETFIKIGITSNSIKKRFYGKTSMPYNFKVLHEIIGSPEYIYNLETLLHKKSKNYKYIPITSFGGHITECFIANKDYLAKLNSYLKECVPF